MAFLSIVNTYHRVQRKKILQGCWGATWFNSPDKFAFWGGVKRVMDRLWWYLSSWKPELWFSKGIMKKNSCQVLSWDLRMSTHGLTQLLKHLGLLSIFARAKDWQKNDQSPPEVHTGSLCCAEAGEDPAWCDLIPPPQHTQWHPPGPCHTPWNSAQSSAGHGHTGCTAEDGRQWFMHPN